MNRFFVALLGLLCSTHLSALIDDLDQAKTEHPLVLVYGLFGFDSIWDYRYWGELKDNLELNGAKVYIAKVSQAHSPHRRGQQLLQQLETWGHNKYHIIAHSMGGLDARYVLEHHSYLIASILTIATPHRGSKVADFIMKVEGLPWASQFVWHTGNLACHLVAYLSDSWHEQDIKHALQALTTSGMEEFNTQYPLGIQKVPNDAKLFSLGLCHKTPKNLTDICALTLFGVGKIFFGSQENDGVVAKISMNFGCWLGDVQGAHHLMPVKSGLAYYSTRAIDEFLTIILDHVKRLKEDGL